MPPNVILTPGTLTIAQRTANIHPQAWDPTLHRFSPLNQWPLTTILDKIGSGMTDSKVYNWFEKPSTEKVEALPPPPPSGPVTSSESLPSNSEPLPKSKRPSRSRKPAPETKSQPLTASKQAASGSGSPSLPNTSSTAAAPKSRARRSTSSRSSRTTGATSNSDSGN